MLMLLVLRGGVGAAHMKHVRVGNRATIVHQSLSMLLHLQVERCVLSRNLVQVLLLVHAAEIHLARSL